MAVARDVLDPDRVVVDEVDRDHADRCFEFRNAVANAAEVRERNRHADRAVAAHAEVARIVEEDHAGRAFAVGRLAQERADQRVGASWLEDHGLAKVVVFATHARQPLLQAADAEVRPALDHDACRFALGMGVDHPHVRQPCLASCPTSCGTVATRSRAAHSAPGSAGRSH